MQALKVLVVVMGVLIVGGTVALAVLIVQRFNAAAPLTAASIGLGQPPGSRIAGLAAAEGALAIWVTRPDGERVLLVDPRRGRVTGEVRLETVVD